ncbi:MAG: hypothetical protein JKY42_06155, partial [Flavobacteriales bacterium]|nr:hypothetical protein [Flavobacteriales bacterium]
MNYFQKLKKVKIFSINISPLFVLCITASFGYTQQYAVDPFTGDFSYGLSLPSVPSPDGPASNIGISYSAGIGVGQPASDIGLGWGLGAAGSITRSVHIIPDDFDGQAFCVACEDFTNRTGILKGAADLKGGSDDFYETGYKIPGDSAFRFPAYDFYAVSGPLNGNLTPRLTDFVQFGEDINLNNGDAYLFSQITTDNKLQFQFKGGFQGDYTSVHYPNSDITNLYVPGDDISGSSVSNVSGNINTATGRLHTAMYVEYFTNEQIQNHYTTEELGTFLDYESGLTGRDFNEFEKDGIGAFRITDPNGYVYHYSLPLYTNSVTTGSYPLTQNYALASTQEINPPDELLSELNGLIDQIASYPVDGLEIPQNLLDVMNAEPSYEYQLVNATRTGKSDGSYLKRNQDSLLIEYKTIFRYAIEWKLTAVTGPRYEDSNDNQIPDEGDKGYWVRYDYAKWTDHFKERNNVYGMVPVYNPSNSHITHYNPVYSLGKLTGKYATYSEADYQIYYLNRVQTETNSALFIRTLRKDEHSMPHVYEGLDDQYAPAVLSMPATPPNLTVTTWEGTLYDDGGAKGIMGSVDPSEIITYVTIQPTDAQTVTITIEEFDFLVNQDEFLEIYDGPDQTLANLVYRFGTNLYNGGSQGCKGGGVVDGNCHLDLSAGPWSYTSSSGAITIGLKTHAFTGQSTGAFQRDGFKLTWTTNLPDNYFKATPALRLDKIVYLNNAFDDALSTPVVFDITAIDERDKHVLFDGTFLDNTATFYSSEWYENNKTQLEDKAWSIVEFDQDYQLANGYFSNIDVLTDPAPLKLDLPTALLNKLTITSGQEENSGKLTLNKVTIFDESKTQLTPSYAFDYTVGKDFPNPDFDPRTYDNWSLYKA